MNYTRKTDEEVKQLATDLYAGRIFTDRHLSRTEDVGLVFMALSLIGSDMGKELTDILGERGMVYEYMDQAGPTGINGNPCFFSVRFLNGEDADRVEAKFKSIRDAVEAA